MTARAVFAVVLAVLGWAAYSVTRAACDALFGHYAKEREQ